MQPVDVKVSTVSLETVIPPEFGRRKMVQYYSNRIAPASRRRYSFTSVLPALFVIVLATLIIGTSFLGCATKSGQQTITAFCGSASKPAMEEAAKAFTERTGISVYLNFGGSGTMLSQMKISKEGDLYIPGSPDYMVMAERDGVVNPGSAKIVAYLVPAIVVQPGNPKNIRELSDLSKPDIKIGIGNPESVCVGLYAFEILGHSNMLEAVGRNIVTYAESCEKTATLVALKSVDAILGWDVFPKWNPGTMDAVYLKPEQIPRIAYIPAAVSTFSKDSNSARKFQDFLASPEGQKIFSKWGYITTESEARKFAPDAEIGGEYKLPKSYKPLVK
jgi:molybdate transport system substrate-binding protein